MAVDGRLEARFRAEDMQDPVLLSTAEDVDDLVDTLLTGPPLHDAVQLLSRARPKTWSGFWDHALYVGVSRNPQLGTLMLTAPEVERIASVGISHPRTGVIHHVAGHWTEFSDDSEIPVALVRQAVKEFLLSGGNVPTCIEWKPFVDVNTDADEDDIW